MGGPVLGGCRVALGVLALVAVVVRLFEGSGDADFSAANFFSYFTIQSNLIAAGVLLVAGAGLLRGRSPSERLDLWRGAATLYIATTGVVYSLLLAADEPNLLRVTNVVLHYLMPIAVVVDWAVDRPRWAILFRRAAVWIAYPAAFIAYTLVRGAIVDWYPYPFVDVSERGYPAVLLTTLVLGAAMLGLIWLLARTTRPRAARPPADERIAS
jgi:hypothetical protein